MCQVYVFVEGASDAEFLRRILPPEVPSGAAIVCAGGSSGIPLLARSVLVRRRKPIVVVVTGPINRCRPAGCSRS